MEMRIRQCTIKCYCLACDNQPVRICVVSGIHYSCTDGYYVWLHTCEPLMSTMEVCSEGGNDDVILLSVLKCPLFACGCRHSQSCNGSQLPKLTTFRQ